jgi:ribonuclease HII
MGPKATYRTRTYLKKGRVARTPRVPGVRLERALIEDGAELVGGIDEVGVGAWAGPLAVGAVVLRPDRRIYKIRDSKLLDPARREFLAARVQQSCLAWSIGLTWPDEIDTVGLSEAQRRAAARALDGLAVEPDVFLVDGKWNFLNSNGTAQMVRMVVRGDCESVSIAAASIVAKVTRDRLMCELDAHYPFYALASNKGYPSPRHRWGLAAFGPCPIHRRLFAPVQKLLDEGVPGRLLPPGRPGG